MGVHSVPVITSIILFGLFVLSCLTIEAVSLAKDQGSKPNITIGFLATFTGDGIGKLIAGAITVAVMNVNKRPDLLPNHALQFIPADAGERGTSVAIKKMTRMRDDGAVAFIGPDESCVSEALVAAAWNYPMITYKCSDRKVSNKNIYTTFARTLPPSSKVSKYVISLLKHFKWNKVVLVVSENHWYKQAEEALAVLAKDSDIEVTKTYFIPNFYISGSHEKDIKKIIDESFMITRSKCSDETSLFISCLK
ncbi:guanylate cyclase 32E-like [Limulus polyphemus]|uniref:Guanylate cyclase 32E-like n=1 Tax=Limulus polyphemus TaxID=6850 RepID=A0ABM1T0E0_LIMPO|nr:guanylate cyclase 32E-like [Limulus polyphemus]